MFTGIVEETGVIKKKILNLDGMELTIHANKVLEDLKVNDSISCSGVCLTVTKLFDTSFVVQLVEETIDRTTAKFWDVNSRINLERSLLPTTRLGGHFVQGHVDDIGKVVSVKKNKNSWCFWFKIKNNFSKFLIKKGSIAINGVSLTINEIKKNNFRADIIPHTFKKTNLRFLKKNMIVNIEFDLLIKFLRK